MIPARRWRRVLVAAVAILIAGAALPAAGAGAEGQLATRLAAFAGLALAAAAYSGRPPVGRIAWPLAALAALALVAGLQSLSWPLAAVRSVSGAHAELTVGAHRLLERQTAGATLSLAPDLSRAAALALLAAAATFFAGFVAGASRDARRWLAGAVVAAGVAQVIFGARDWLSGATSRLNGTFVNPNHLAYLLEIGLAVAFAWSLWALRAQRRASSLETRLALVAAPLAGGLILAAGLVATGSRAGLAAAAACFAVQWCLVPRALGQVRRGMAYKVLAVSSFAGLAALLARGVGRLGETTIYEVGWGDRALVWRESLALWRRFPLTGSGLGTFGEAFPLRQPEAMTELYWRRAHNGAIELLVTGGVVGAALGALLVVGVVCALGRALARGERSEDRVAALAAVGAVVAVSVHEMMDFGLTLPGIALPMAAVAGAGAAVRFNRRSSPAGHAPDADAGGRRDRPSAGAASRDRR